LQATHQRQAVDARHHQVRDHEIDPASLEQLQAFLTARSFHNVEAEALEPESQAASLLRVVIDDQDACSQRTTSARQRKEAEPAQGGQHGPGFHSQLLAMVVPCELHVSPLPVPGHGSAYLLDMMTLLRMAAIACSCATTGR
jgi:hypothetical protein